jgi:predicted transcriptional regulator
MDIFAEEAVPRQANPAWAADRIFDLLKRKGPLCASQISVELLVPLRDVTAALRQLRDRREVEPRRVDVLSKEFDEECAPWGLAKHVRRR